MDILKLHKDSENELNICYSIIQLQLKAIKDLTDKVNHLEELLKHEPIILNFNKE